MDSKHLSPGSASSIRWRGALNAAGVIVLVLGLGAAALVYQRGQPRTASGAGRPASATAGDWQDESIPFEDSKSATRDIELYGGKLEVLMVRLQAKLRRPGSQAGLIAAGAIAVALGCFLAARHQAPVQAR